MTAPTPEQQSILDTQWNRVADKVTVHPVNETNVADLLYHGPSDLGRALGNTKVLSRVDGNAYPLVTGNGDGFLSGLDQKVWQTGQALTDVSNKVNDLSAKLDQVLVAVAALAPKAP